MAPTFVEGNPDCEDLVELGLLDDTGLEHFKIDPVPDNLNQTFEYTVDGVGTITITITAVENESGGESYQFDWTSTFGIDAVFVKGGDGGNLYDYQVLANEPLSDSFLVTPTNDNNDNPFAISHIDFCYDDGQTEEDTFAIEGFKFYDTNVSGAFEPGEDSPLAGWTIYLDDDTNFNNGVIASVMTNEFGTFQFTNTGTDGEGVTVVPDLDAGTWYVYEGAAPPDETWLQTLGGGTPVTSDPAPPPAGAATVGAYTVVLTETIQTSAENAFGNVQLGEGGGHTLGFWSNKNGQKLITESGPDNDLDALNALNLKNADGSDFAPTTAGQVKTWLLNADATNMSYMLSVQLAVMTLNVRHEFVDGDALIYAPGTESADALGFASISAILAEANEELGIHGTAAAGDAWRGYQESLKNALDEANNNENFVLPPP